MDPSKKCPRIYVGPGCKETTLVRMSLDKNGEILQDCDVYIGPHLNNSNWVMEKSMWCNPFFSREVSPKLCNQRYERHILSSPHLRRQLPSLIGKRLGCICPNYKHCHGHVLLKLLKDIKREEEETADFAIDNCFFFKGNPSPFSNCYAKTLRTDEGKFINAQHLFYWRKANAMKDKFLIRNIERCRSAAEVFTCSRCINYQPSPWTSAEAILNMYEILKLKWDQVEEFRNRCTACIYCLPFECTRDDFWGCGLDMATLLAAKGESAKFDVRKIIRHLPGMNVLGWLIFILTVQKNSSVKSSGLIDGKNISAVCRHGFRLVSKILADENLLTDFDNTVLGEEIKDKKKKKKKKLIQEIL